MTASEPGEEELPRCEACTDVIGMYEPIVVLHGQRPVMTSRAGLPGALPEGARCWHRDCFEEHRVP